MSAFTNLPDLCLLALFKQLPLLDLITSHQTCIRWQNLIISSLRSRRSLTLFVGRHQTSLFKSSVDRWAPIWPKMAPFLRKANGRGLLFPMIKLTPWNYLHYRQLRPQTINHIDRLFTGITELQIVIECTDAELDSIVRLLHYWRHQLITLKFGEFFNFPVPTSSAERLFTAINGLTALRYLALDLKELPCPDLPIISQLVELDFDVLKDSTSTFLTMLQDYCSPDSPLQRIKYQCNEYGNTFVEKILSTGEEHQQQLCRRFSHLDFSGLGNLALIGSHFSSLTSLHIWPSDTTVRDVFSHLTQLTALYYLIIRMDFPQMLPDDREHLRLPQLPSVKAVQLYLTIQSHLDVATLALDWTTPNVQVISFYFLVNCECTTCGIFHYQCTTSATIAKHCLGQLFSTLKRKCSQLRAILHNEEADLGTAEELIALQVGDI